MLAESRIILLLSGMLLLGVGILLGFIIDRRTGKKSAHIQELEEQLVQSRKELEDYKALVNEHFIKTSELVDQMTASYRAIFMHLANGAQALSGQSPLASLKMPEDEFFAPAQPQDQGAGEDEIMPEEEHEEVAAALGEKSEPEKSGQTIDRETLEIRGSPGGSEGAELVEAQPQEELTPTKTAEESVEPEVPSKDEKT